MDSQPPVLLSSLPCLVSTILILYNTELNSDIIYCHHKLLLNLSTHSASGYHSVIFPICSIEKKFSESDPCNFLKMKKYIAIAIGSMIRNT